MRDDVRVVTFGLGKVVCNYGTYEGFPAVFIEPADPAGVVGEASPEGPRDSVLPRSVVLQFQDMRGAEILIEDIRSAQKGLPRTDGYSPKVVD